MKEIINKLNSKLKLKIKIPEIIFPENTIEVI